MDKFRIVFKTKLRRVLNLQHGIRVSLMNGKKVC